MTTPTCRVASCGRPVADAYCCSRCAADLERALGDIPAITHQLNLTLAKVARFADRNERPGNETPLPIDPRASEVAGELRAHLVSWARLISEERGHTIPVVEALNHAADLDLLSRWMLHHVEWLRHHEAGNEAIEELVGDMRTARRVIDVPANRTTFPVGPCPEFTFTAVTYTPGRGGLAPVTTPLAAEANPSHCPGEVRAYIPNTEDQPARLECGTCHTVWDSTQWLRAGRRILDRKATMKGSAA